jgi:hypothetical protein
LGDFPTAIKFSDAKQPPKKPSFSNNPVRDFKARSQNLDRSDIFQACRGGFSPQSEPTADNLCTKPAPTQRLSKFNSEIRKEHQLLIQQKVYEGEEFIDRPIVSRDTALDKSGYSLPQ